MTLHFFQPMCILQRLEIAKLGRNETRTLLNMSRHSHFPQYRK